MNDILSALDALAPGDAIFDLDGTLLRGDIGMSAMQILVERGHLPDAVAAVTGREDPVGKLWEISETRWCYAGDVAAWMLEGLRQDEVEQIVDEAFARGLVAPVPAVCELAAAIGLRHRVWILTGSAEVLGKAVGPRVGIHHVAGVRLAWEGDRLSRHILSPIPCGPGKVEAARAWISGTPVFAIGDSPHDLPVLRLAQVARTVGRASNMEFPAFITE